MSFSIGLIGYGAFGAFLHALQQRFLPDAELKIHSGSREPDGELFFPLDAVGACDAVVLTVPISAYERTLQRLEPHLGASTVLIDVATVKAYTMGLVSSVRAGQPFLSMHPMFGPESYAKRNGEVSGFRIVVTGHKMDPALYRTLCDGLVATGFSLVEKSADAHDRDLAETLFLTHYIGQVVAQGGFERTDIDTVSFGYLMDAVDSVRHDSQLFEEVCRFNPYCRQVIERFDASDTLVRDKMLKLRAPARNSI